MPAFHPYTIHHLQLDEIDRLTLPAGNHYLVFWQGKIPLGHLWLDGNTSPISLADHRAAIDTATLAGKTPPERSSTRTPADKPLPEGSSAFIPTDKPLPANASVTPSVPPDSPHLSVIICTRNRTNDLQRCIRVLLEDSSDKDFELIVVDNAPDDDQTEQLLQPYHEIRYIKEPRKGLDIARNTGARMASHPLIAYTDDDVLVDKDWIANLKKCFADPLVMAVTGLVIPAELKTKSQYIFERHWSFNKGYLPKTFDHRWFLDHLPYGVPAWDIGAGANMAFRREVFDLVGWFDERLDVGASGCSGDSEFWYRILAEGWNCSYLPHIYVYHRHRDTMTGLSSQLFHYMRGHVSSLLVQYERYRHKGDRRRIFTGLPHYYWQRIKERITGHSENFNTLITEIKGCFSGWRFYHRTQRPVLPPLSIPGDDPLRGKVILTPDTLVSVIIPSYNHAHYLRSAIQSVLDQTCKNTEIIVVDDGSTDDTAAICHEYKGLRYVRTERVGPCAARNIGVGHSRGSFVLFLDADDLLYPNAIELNLYYFGLYPDIVFVSGAFDRIDDQGRYLPAEEAVIRAEDNYRFLLQGNYIGMEATVLYRRQLFFRFHFDPRVTVCEDYDLNLRIARHLPVFGHTTKVAAYRIHAGNRSKDRKKMLRSALAVLGEQEKGLLNEEERTAWRLGMENWKKYYG